MTKPSFSKFVTSGLILCLFISIIGPLFQKVEAGEMDPDFTNKELSVEATASELFEEPDTNLTERGASINPVGIAKGGAQKVTIIVQQCASTNGDSVSIVNQAQLKSDGIEPGTPGKINNCAFVLNINVRSQAMSGVARRIEFATSTEHSYVDLTILGQDSSNQPATKSIVSNEPEDVIIGDPQPIPYSQAFPLLDGLFQDVAAIQISALDLNANSSNVNRLDALMQQFQASFQYSQTLGLLNSGAAQQSAANAASGAFQTQLINQQSQLITSLLAAQQQLLQAQRALDALPATATDARAAATQTRDLANDNVTSITQQLTSVKNYLLTAAPANPTYNAPSPSPVTFPSPSVAPVLPLAQTPSNDKAFTPSFPASKQMENQVSLLWERLANLVNTLVQTNNPANTYLVKFNTSILFGKAKRKRQLLTTQYALECVPDPSDGDRPASNNDEQRDNKIQVLDLFPRKAAVNIAEEKYKDSKTGLAALLSFFSIGGNVSYNREHLQITQALGQSAYITGYGIQTSSFGWVFGPTLGEDAPAPGDRTTFALVSFPQNCGSPKIKLVNVAWDKSPYVVNAQKPALRDLNAWFPRTTEGKPRCKDCDTGVAYTPAEYDPANLAGSANDKVTIDITLNADLDREETVSVNGNILSRARDKFGRATVRSSNDNVTGGLLETNALNAGTWLPVGSREIILNLNPASFKDRFPSIILTSPKGTIDITSRITKAKIGGTDYICPPNTGKPCALVLPSIGRPRPSLKKFFVGRWKGEKSYHIVFKSLDPPQPVSKTVSGLSAIQVINNSQGEPWSTHATVVARQGGNAYPLQCEPRGEYLDCDAGLINPTERNKSGNYGKFNPTEMVDFDIFDGDYWGGSAKGSSMLQRCMVEECFSPLVWRIDDPEWIAEDGTEHKNGWLLHMVLVNVERNQTVQLDGGFDTPIQCPPKKTQIDQPDRPDRPDQLECTADIFIPMTDFSKMRNSMKFSVMNAEKTARVGNTSQIGNIRLNISPKITSITDDQMRFTGENLVFNSIVVGTGSRAHEIKIECDKLKRECFIPENAGFAPKDEGYLYFKAYSELIEFVTVDDKGIHPIAAHHPPKQTQGGAPQSATNTPPPTSETKRDPGEIKPTRIFVSPQ